MRRLQGGAVILAQERIPLALLADKHNDGLWQCTVYNCVIKANLKRLRVV